MFSYFVYLERVKNFALNAVSSHIVSEEYVHEYAQGLVSNSDGISLHATQGLRIATAESFKIEELVKAVEGLKSNPKP